MAAFDDPNAGWKGRGVLVRTTGNRTPFHMEGGKGTTPRSEVPDAA